MRSNCCRKHTYNGICHSLNHSGILNDTHEDTYREQGHGHNHGIGTVLFNFLILLLCVREVYDQSDGKCYHENGIQRNRKVTE